MVKSSKSTGGAKATKRSSLRVKDYEKLGRAIQAIQESGYSDHNKLYRIQFLRGIFFGLGTAIGGTLVLACLIWILTLFTEVPFVGELADVIRSSVE